jgi:4-amino-4-deoxy-L-arabinose transferase-like glycosyltransferase
MQFKLSTNARLSARSNGWRLEVVALLLGIGFVVRALFCIFCAGEIDTEGAEYARIAQNLSEGNGYVGIATPGTQLFFPPLFPYLIAGAGLLIGNAELAGRTVSLLFGSLLVIPVWLIGYRMLGERAGVAAGAVIAIHPYLVWLSTTVHCEAVYLTLILAAVYTTMSAAEAPTKLRLAASGALYGVAYLVRPEALVFMVVGLAGVLLGRAFLREKPSAVLGRLLLVPLVFVVVTGPYILWLSAQVGSLRLEGKSPLNIETEMRRQRGSSIDEAGMAVGKDLRPQGVWNQPNISILRTHHSDAKLLGTMIARKTKIVLRDAAATIAGGLAFGSPALFAIAAVGMFRRPWRPALALDQVHLMIVSVFSVAATYFIYFSTWRFYVISLIIMCIWTYPGLKEMGTWGHRSARVFGLTEAKRQIASVIVMALAAVAILLPAAGFAVSEAMASRASRSVKAVAMGLASKHTLVRIADTSTPFAFHARAQFVWMPFCDEETALRFLVKAGVTHIILRGNGVATRPYLAKWMAEGVPHASLKHEFTTDVNEIVKVYSLEQTR